MANRTPDDTIDRIVALYAGGLTMKAIEASTGISYTAIRNGLVRRGIDRREKPKFVRVRKVNETYFDEIDTEEKAYWLGFLMADGCVRDGRMTLLLSSRDADHIHKFAAAIKTDYPIQQRRSFSMGAWRDATFIEVHRAEFVAGLMKHGVVPRKSHDGKPCLLERSELQRHYWRGMFDGDGSISKAAYPNRNWVGYQANFCGNEAIVNAFAEFIRSRSSHPCTVRPVGNQFSFQFSGVGALQKSLAVLYADASVYLDRKYQIYQDLMQLPNGKLMVA